MPFVAADMRERSNIDTRRFPSLERGSILIVTLLILLTLTMLALAASHATKSQTRAASAAEQRDKAFQAAEAALRAAERLLMAHEPGPACKDNGRCRIYEKGTFSAQEVLQASVGWWHRYGWSYTDSSVWPKDDADSSGSRFIIEDFVEAHQPTAGLAPDSGSTRYYRIFAASEGAGKPLVLLQSVFAHEQCPHPQDNPLAQESDRIAPANLPCPGQTSARQSWRQLR